MNKTIVVNATALNQSGALSILKQFIRAIPADEYEYILFVSNKVNLDGAGQNVRLIRMDVQSYFARFIWDAFGAKIWLKKNDIYPTASISLQNTNFRTRKSIPNFIYYHQSIPFFNKKWNPLNSSERLPWFYKNIYPFFVKLFINRETEIFVQIDFIRDRFAKYYNFPISKIFIISPKIELPALADIKLIHIDNNQLNLFYPANAIIYKNHSIILKALSLLEQKLQEKITLHLTCRSQELTYLLKNLKIGFKINFAGKMPFNEVLGMYKEADALLFPSYIESFGFPLVEAASFGMPIISADVPYSHETLKDYPGVSYVSYNNPLSWSEKITMLLSHKGERFQPVNFEQSGSWPELFRILKNKIK